MKKIPEVETAKALMTEALGWSVLKWLREKKRVRKVADQANAALDHGNRLVKHQWPAAIRAAYEALDKQQSHPMKTADQNESRSATNNAQAISSAKRVKAADEEAYRARMDAEDTFDIAEKQLSTALAREGCKKAIRSWQLHENATRMAEELIG